ncbi:MAG: IS3 family transposase [Candidatus Aminicenantes bacterium]|nr:IS3 family transposase [Candidatus Aminicenantes bacterium]
MARKRYSPEQVISMLREAEVIQNKGMTVIGACRKLGISEQTYYRWRKDYGGMRVDQAKRLKELELENARLKKLVADLSLDNAILKEASPGKLLSPAKKSRAVSHVCKVLAVSERKACQVLGQPRSTQRHVRKIPEDEDRLVERVIALASQYDRYGYRRITALLKHEGWHVNHKRVERIWRQEGLKVPSKQPKRGRLWLTDGSCIRLCPTKRNHVWSYDMAMIRTTDGRALRILVIIDEFTRECLSIYVARRIKHHDVLEQLYGLFLDHGTPEHIRSDNAPEFTAKAVRKWLTNLEIKTLYIEPGSPWENGYVESFIGKLRDELLNGETFDTLLEARVLIELWRKEYNGSRPHSSLGYKPPAPEAYEVKNMTQQVVH